MSRLKQIEIFFDALFETGGNIALAFIRRLAPFSVPAAPAFFFGHAVYTAVLAMSGLTAVAIAVGLVAAAGLESVGILSAHIAVRLQSSGERGKALVAGGIAVFYLVVGIAGIWLLESTSRDAKITGTVMFLIAGAVYLLLGLVDDDGARQSQAHRAEQARQEQEREQAAWEREQAEKDRELARQLKAQAATARRPEGGQKAATTPSDWRLLAHAEKVRMLDLTTGEIARKYDVSDSTARRWLRNARQLTAPVTGEKAAQNGAGR